MGLEGTEGLSLWRCVPPPPPVSPAAPVGAGKVGVAYLLRARTRGCNDDLTVKGDSCSKKGKENAERAFARDVVVWFLPRRARLEVVGVSFLPLGAWLGLSVISTANDPPILGL